MKVDSIFKRFEIFCNNYPLITNTNRGIDEICSYSEHASLVKTWIKKKGSRICRRYQKYWWNVSQNNTDKKDKNLVAKLHEKRSAHSEPRQTSKMKLFKEIVNGFHYVNYCCKKILHVWLSSEETVFVSRLLLSSERSILNEWRVRNVLLRKFESKYLKEFLPEETSYILQSLIEDQCDYTIETNELIITHWKWDFFVIIVSCKR